MGVSTEHPPKECSAEKGKMISFGSCYSLTAILAAREALLHHTGVGTCYSVPN